MRPGRITHVITTNILRMRPNGCGTKAASQIHKASKRHSYERKVSPSQVLLAAMRRYL